MAKILWLPLVTLMFSCATKSGTVGGATNSKNMSVAPGTKSWDGHSLWIDEGGTIFPSLIGDKVKFTGPCGHEGETIEYEGKVSGRTQCKSGRWSTPEYNVELFREGAVPLAVSTPKSSPTESYAAGFTVVNLLSEGAVGDGKADDQLAIERAIAKANKSVNGVVYAPMGHVFAHSNVVHLKNLALVGAGATSVVRALNPAKGAIILEGDRSRLMNLTIESPPAHIARQSIPNANAVTIDRAQNFWIDRVSIVGAAGSGIFNYGGAGSAPRPARITNNSVEGTLAYGIHNTQGARYVLIEKNSVTKTGDDSIAVVSYANNPARCSDIEMKGNSLSFSKARGIAVVGGNHFTLAENQIAETDAAGILVAADSNSKTLGVDGATVRLNHLRRTSLASKSQAGIFVRGQPNAVVKDIKVEQNIIEETPPPGISIQAGAQKILVRGNRILQSGKSALTVLGGTDVRILGNEFDGAAESGIFVDAAQSGQLLIAQNNFRGMNTENNPKNSVVKVLRRANKMVQVHDNKYDRLGVKMNKPIDLAR